MQETWPCLQKKAHYPGYSLLKFILLVLLLLLLLRIITMPVLQATVRRCLRGYWGQLWSPSIKPPDENIGSVSSPETTVNCWRNGGKKRLYWLYADTLTQFKFLSGTLLSTQIDHVHVRYLTVLDKAGTKKHAKWKEPFSAVAHFFLLHCWGQAFST